MSGISFQRAAVFMGTMLYLALSAGPSSTQEKDKFYNPDGNDENVVYQESAADEKKLKDFYGLSEEDLHGKITLGVETDEETRIANEKWLKEQEKQKAQDDRITAFLNEQKKIKTTPTQKDFFDGINRTGNADGNTTRGTDETSITVPADDLVTLNPLQLNAQTQWSGQPAPFNGPKLVVANSYADGAQVKQGTNLDFSFTAEYPNGAWTITKAVLFSAVENPTNTLSNATLKELGIDDDNAFKWQKTTHAVFKTAAFVTRHLNKKAKYASSQKKTVVLSGHYRLNTARLKPGLYYFRVLTQRKVDGVFVEKDEKGLKFYIVDAPLYLAANIPTSLSSYNPDRNVWAGEYMARISDWAVLPMTGTISPNNSGFTLDNSGKIYESLFTLYMRPGKAFIGRKQSFTLKVTDGLGRTAVLNRNLNITDSRDTEIKVSMPNSVNAGRSITGTVMYPAGFVLSKTPRIGDPRGFTWTSSDYTTFRINVNEEGVHHKRLFAIIASGTFGNAAEAQVLTWKREYQVKSQNLIYDEERNRRRTEANNKAWREAFSAVASGIGVAASAYAEANSVNPSDTSNDPSDGSNNEYEIDDGDNAIHQGRADNDTDTGTTPQNVNINTGSSAGYTQSAETPICTINVSGPEWKVTKKDKYSPTIVHNFGRTNKNGHHYQRWQSMYKKPKTGESICRLKREYIPQQDGSVLQKIYKRVRGGGASQVYVSEVTLYAGTHPARSWGMSSYENGQCEVTFNPNTETAKDWPYGNMLWEKTYFPSGQIESERAYDRGGLGIAGNRKGYYKDGYTRYSDAKTSKGCDLWRKQYYRNGNPEYHSRHNKDGSSVTDFYNEDGSHDKTMHYDKNGDQKG